jgi:hypothetical protein
VPFQLRPEKKDTVVCPLLRRSKYDQKKKKKNAEKIIYEKKNFTIYCSCTVPIVIWPSFVTPFQLPWLRRSNYDRKQKKIQLSVRCYAIPITTGKKRYSRLAIIRCAIPIAIVVPFQLRPEKKDTVICPLLRHSNYDQKKKIQ